MLLALFYGCRFEAFVPFEQPGQVILIVPHSYQIDPASCRSECLREVSLKIVTSGSASLTLTIIRSLMIGNTPSEDQYNGFFMPIEEQIEFACGVLAADPQLQAGFHAVGFSQACDGRMQPPYAFSNTWKPPPTLSGEDPR
jgi:hypothetical protein